MKIVKTSELNENQKNGVFKIWNDEYPHFLAYKSMGDFESYLIKLKNAEHNIVSIENEIKGWVVKFDRHEEKWFVIIVTSQIQGKGIGENLIDVIKTDENELNGWVIDRDSYYKKNGELYKSPIGFYKKNGFEITNDRFENKLFMAVKVKWTKNPVHKHSYN